MFTAAMKKILKAMVLLTTFSVLITYVIFGIISRGINPFFQNVSVVKKYNPIDTYIAVKHLNATHKKLGPVTKQFYYLSITGKKNIDPKNKHVSNTRKRIVFTEKHPYPVSEDTKRTNVLILATKRSGSSFLGQVFNHHPDVFYLFEPLYHLEAFVKETNLEASRSLLKSLFYCDLLSLGQYINPQARQLFRRGASKALCSPPVCNLSLSTKLDMEETVCSKNCPPVNFMLASQACRQLKYVVIKTVRVPNINDVRALVEDPRVNLKVIQLVRDPRGILSSRVNTFGYKEKLLNIWQKTGERPENLEMTQLTQTCNNFFTSVSMGWQKPDWLKGHYMLVRYEDLALDPIQKTKEMFKYAGLSEDNSAIAWVKSTTQGGNKVLTSKKFGTVRNSRAEAEEWRLKLPYELVRYTQSLCVKILQQLGYKTVNSDNELKNMSHTLIEDIDLNIQ